MSEQDTNQGNAPIQTLRDGAIVVKLWQQNSENGLYVTATLGRTYQDEETGQYGESRSLGANDVLKAQALLLDANREIGKWKEYFREQSRAQGHDTPARQASEPAQARGLAAQRDAAMAQAKPADRNAHAPDRGPER